MHKYEIKPELYKILIKLFKKDRNTYEFVIKKIEEITNSQNIEHYKNLKYGLKKFKRVHIGSFVLIFNYDKLNNIIIFEEFNHHDNIYE